MSSRTKRFFSLLLRTLHASRRLLPVAFVRRSKTKAHCGAAACGCSHSTPTTLSVHSESTSSADTQSFQGLKLLSTVTIGRLPFEILCGCLVDFDLEELLPLRLVSKTWLAAVNYQEEYSRYIHNMPDYFHDDDMDKLDELFGLDPQTPVPVDLLRARITCSSRLIMLYVGTSWIPNDEARAIINLIAEHLERIELLWIELSAKIAPALYDALQRPVPFLCEFTLRVRTCSKDGSTSTYSAAVLPHNIFTGRAPLLDTVSLLNAALDPSVDYPAFSQVKDLSLHYETIEDIQLSRMLFLCPHVESLSIETDKPTDHDVSRLRETVPPPHLKSLRLATSRIEDQLALLDALSSPATESVSMPMPRNEPRLAMWQQLRGLGPFTFYVDSDQSSELLRMHIKLSSNTLKRVRAADVHEYQHWEWEDVEEALLEEFEECALAADIVLVHLALRREGFSTLAMLSKIHSDWPAVRTVRLDFVGGRGFAPRLHCGFPVLEQVVLFLPDMPLDARDEQISYICETLMGFFDCSNADTVTFILTRDRETADLVTSNPETASKNPQCIVRSWDSEEIEV